MSPKLYTRQYMGLAKSYLPGCAETFRAHRTNSLWKTPLWRIASRKYLIW